MEETLTFRTKTGNILSSTLAQWAIIICFVILTFIEDDLAYFFGLIAVLLFLWSRKWGWNLIWLNKPKSWKKVWLEAFLWSFLILIVVDMVITPLLEITLNQPADLSGFDNIRGNLINYIVLIIFMWIVAAFGEEFVFRGLLVKRLGILLGNSKIAFWIAVLISSILFGYAHKYQGIVGMVSTGTVGFILGALYINNKNRLWLTILTHGVYDVIGITLLYLDMENDVYGLLKNLFV